MTSSPGVDGKSRPPEPDPDSLPLQHAGQQQQQQQQPPSPPAPAPEPAPESAPEPAPEPALPTSTLVNGSNEVTLDESKTLVPPSQAHVTQDDDDTAAAAAAAEPMAQDVNNATPSTKPDPDAVPTEGPSAAAVSPAAQQQQQHDPAPVKTEPMDANAIHTNNVALNGNMMAELQPFPQMEYMAIMQLTAIREYEDNWPPQTHVAPADMTLQPPAAGPMDTSALSGGAHRHGGARAHGADAGPGLESFARLEFADSVFQMTTYSVIIGRDQRALTQARVDERRKQDYDRLVEEHHARGLPPPTPPSQKQGKFSKSYVSEEGGMLGPESDGDSNPRPAKRRRTSGGGGSGARLYQKKDEPVGGGSGGGGGGISGGNDEALAETSEQNLEKNRQYVSHTPGAAMVDVATLRPSPHHVPFLGIHSPGPDIATKTKAISRQHLKIAFNQKTSMFEAIPLHRNGFFRDDTHYRDEPVVLRSGDRLQVKDVSFTFIINGVKHGMTGAEEEYEEEEETSSRRYSEGGKEMSFEFESSHAEEMMDTSEDEEEQLAHAADQSDPEISGEEEEEEDEDEAEDEDEEADEEDEDEIMETVESDEPEPEPEPEPEVPPPPPKKRGPGRPPKNGIMSKREERLRKKMALEEAKKAMPPPPPGEPPIKRKVGRPRKHPIDENGEKPEKRKYKPRKPKNPEDGAAGSDGEKPVKEKRREKPKTPPLELNKEDFTPEQLEKPSKNYGILIDEVLAAAPPQGFSLKQIYKRIQERYPYFYFFVETKGWESSVRHNLIGNAAFTKHEETQLWSRIPGVELDAGKKRKANSPDHHAPGVMHNLGGQWNAPMAHPQQYRGVNMPPGALPQQGLPPNAAAAAAHQAMNGLPRPQQGFPAQQPGPGGVVNQGGARQGYPLPAQAPTQATQLSGYGQTVGTRPLQPGAQPGSYSSSSPYAPRATPGVMTNAAAAPGQPGAAALQQQQQQQRPLPQAAATTAAAMARPVVASGIATSLQPNLGPSAGPGGPGPSAGPLAAAGIARPPGGGVGGAPSMPLKPAVSPEIVNFVKTFKTQVAAQLSRISKPTAHGEAVAMSVVNRGVGLTTEVMVPGHEDVESIVFGVFTSASAKHMEDGHILDARLLEILKRFKTTWVEKIKPKLGPHKAECLLLSAIDRVLGFSEQSMMEPANDNEAREFASSETLLMMQIQKEVEEYQRSISLSR